MLSFFKVVCFLVSIWGLRSCHGRVFSFQMHHRFSEPVKMWSKTAGKLSLADTLPKKGSVQYYAELARYDRFLRGRNLAESDSLLAFSDGNSTVRINSLAFLHYTTVQLGTPGMKFMVALDTGSDLFWVPCDCNRCASTKGTSYASDFELSVYSPQESTTSKKVTCNSSLCANRNQCVGTSSSCPYVVSYVSAETSTSGILVEDVLHLTTEDAYKKFVPAYIAFGCGQVQSGSFLDVAAPNGLLGLGMEKISVPSVLAREGFIADSFSMCFGHDGTGRINFGDKGSPDQEETPFNLNPLQPAYNVTVTQIRIGTFLVDVNITALFDSGTSFSYLVDPIFTKLSESFDSQVRDRRHLPDSRIPFEYCYEMSPEANTSLLPSMSLTMKGESHFTVYDPIIVISTQAELVYCLAVVRSAEMNIIGQNFMSDYRIVFDRERLVLGWKKFDCYDVEEDNTFLKKPRMTTVPPATAADLSNHSVPETTEGTNNSGRNSFESTYYCFHTFLLTWFRYFIILLVLS